MPSPGRPDQLVVTLGEIHTAIFTSPESCEDGSNAQTRRARARGYHIARLRIVTVRSRHGRRRRRGHVPVGAGTPARLTGAPCRTVGSFMSSAGGPSPTGTTPRSCRSSCRCRNRFMPVPKPYMIVSVAVMPVAAAGTSGVVPVSMPPPAHAALRPARSGTARAAVSPGARPGHAAARSCPPRRHRANRLLTCFVTLGRVGTPLAPQWPFRHHAGQRHGPAEPVGADPYRHVGGDRHKPARPARPPCRPFVPVRHNRHVPLHAGLPCRYDTGTSRALVPVRAGRQPARHTPLDSEHHELDGRRYGRRSYRHRAEAKPARAKPGAEMTETPGAP